MWLLFIEITAAIIATIRGWGFLPILIVIGTVGFGFIAAPILGEDFICVASVIDWVVTIALVVMAITGKKKADEFPTSITIDKSTNNRIKCPSCAELIMPDAKICRFCGYRLQDE